MVSKLRVTKDEMSHQCDVSGLNPQQVPYLQKVSPTHRKRFGQFFTPPRVASLMADWATSHGAKSVLDPAFGTGVLTEACISLGIAARYTAFEKDPLIASYVGEPLRASVNLIVGDFLKHKFCEQFDAVTMNPPYIRHREIEGYEADRSKISASARCLIPRSANMYVYFAVKALSLLKPGGRASFLIPGEWMSANFAASFKDYILSNGYLKEIILFSNCSNVFDDALTTASILLCER